MRPLGSLAVAAAAIALTAAPAGTPPQQGAEQRPPCDQGGNDHPADCCDDRYEECEPHGDVFPD